MVQPMSLLLTVKLCSRVLTDAAQLLDRCGTIMWLYRVYRYLRHSTKAELFMP